MRKYIQTSKELTELLNKTAALTHANFEMLTKLVPWLDAHNVEQRKFRNVVLNKLQRIEGMAQQLLLGQLAEQQGKKLWFTKEKLVENLEAAEEFIRKTSEDQFLNILKYIYVKKPETVEQNAPRDRRKKWHGWEI